MIKSKDLISRHLIGRSPCFLKEIEKISIIAGCDSSVLITGETGKGKEVFVRVIHKLTPQAAEPYMAVNRGAIPPSARISTRQDGGLSAGLQSGQFLKDRGKAEEKESVDDKDSRY